MHGAVLVQNDELHFTAGRSTYLAGGIYFYRLDPLTGKILAANVITHIDAEVEGDAVFPWFDVRGWEANVLEMAPADEKNDYATSFMRYDRVLPAAN